MHNSRLAQILMEELYNKKERQTLILEALNKANFSQDLMDNVIQGLVTYRQKDYWEAKNRRIRSIAHLDNMDIFLSVIASTIDADHPQPIQAVCTKVVKYLDISEDEYIDSIKTAAELIAVIGNLGYVDILMPSETHSGGLEVVSKLACPVDLKTKLHKLKYLPPMVCEPNAVISDVDTSHITTIRPLVLSGRKKDFNLNLEHINTMNSIALSLDLNILRYEEESNKELDTIKKVNQFNLIKDSSLTVYNEIVELGNKFYLTHNFDDRNRCYSAGYHINIQSTDYKKALINLHHKELIK